MPLSIRPALPLGLVLLALVPMPASADDAAADELAPCAAGLPTEGPALLDFLRKRAARRRPGRVQALIRKLADDDFDVREKATADLVAMGPAVRPACREVLQDRDPEVCYRAQAVWVRSTRAVSRRC